LKIFQNAIDQLTEYETLDCIAECNQFFLKLSKI
jgi:hypothetical protein